MSTRHKKVFLIVSMFIMVSFSCFDTINEAVYDNPYDPNCEECEKYSWEASLDSNLVAYYDFNETSGTNLPDVYDGNNNGTVNGAASWVAGKKGNALNFDGVNDYVSLPGYNSTLNDRTWAFWVKLDSYPTFPNLGMIWYRGTSSWAAHHLHIEHSSQKFSYKVYQSGDRYIYTDTVNLDTWYFVVITRSSAARQIYLDGVLNDTDITYAGESNSYNEWLGYHSIGAHYFDGSIDMAGSWNRVLTQNEINTLYNYGLGLQYNE